MKAPFSQIYTKKLGANILQIFIKQQNFLAGEVDLNEGVFYSIPRSNKNLFHLFHGAEGGLGINEEILLRTDFKMMKVKFCDKILTTSRLKWLNCGIVSPYCNKIVDKQIILKLSEINLKDVEKYNPTKEQVNLFERS